MIIFDPPVVKPYAPATQPIAKVAVGVEYDEATKQIIPKLTLIDTKGRRVIIDPEGLPSSKISPEQLASFVEERTSDGLTLAQSLSVRALPILEACYGLVGGKVE